ncbi:MAG: type II toxin-antitoxin system VapC family toxin [Thermoguttaceae bacterium]|jgi:predicted nucleic acid-binding protein
MDIIIDASSIIAVIANEPEKASLIEITRGANLFAPASVHWEIGNAFSAMLKRNRIDLILAQKAIEAYRRIPLRFIDVELSQAIDLSAKLDVYAYDAYIIRAALDQRCALLTLDRGLIKAAKQAGVSVLEIKS